MRVIAKGHVDLIQVRVDGVIAMECNIHGSKVRPGDTFQVDNLEVKMEMN